MIGVRPLAAYDRAWTARFLIEEAGSTRVVSRGILHQADALPGLMAVNDGRPCGLLTYRMDGTDMEVVTLHANLLRQGVGTALLAAARAIARGAGCRRLWLITTNDNDPAIAFYRKRGWKLVAVHKDALTVSRRIKPEIPVCGIGGKPMMDEWEFEIILDPSEA